MTLQYSGEEEIPASHETVWALHRPRRAAPEVVDVTVQDSTHFVAVVRVGVGPVRGNFKIKVELLPAESKRRIDMKMTGGGFGSSVDLAAGADLVDAGGGTTLLKWSGQAEARGPVAAVGGRVLDAQARKLIEQAFGNVRQQLTA